MLESSLVPGGHTPCEAPERPRCEPATAVRHISQEIRDHLSAIESIAFYLQMVLPRADNKARRQLGNLQFQVQQVNWILSDAIHYFEAAPVRTQLADVGEAVSRSLSDWNALHGPDLRLEIEPGLPLAQLDVEHFRHMLRNMAFFLKSVSTPDSPLRIRVFRERSEVLLRLEAAVPEEARKQIELLFEPFDEELPSGPALAVASVRRIAEAHSAKIAVHAAAPYFYLTVAFPAES